MRTTQYIGLTKAAQNFVGKMKKVDYDSKTSGMFGEDVPLGAWISDTGELYCEIVQVVSWSSGPMIFTCLTREITCDEGEKMFKWAEDESVKGQEYDQEKGIFWV